MPLFGADPKDELIATLRDERDHLRARVRELEEQLLALTSPAAFRVVHPAAAPPAKPREANAAVDPYTARSVTYVPDKRLSEIKSES